MRGSGVNWILSKNCKRALSIAMGAMGRLSTLQPYVLKCCFCRTKVNRGG